MHFRHLTLAHALVYFSGTMDGASPKRRRLMDYFTKQPSSVEPRSSRHVFGGTYKPWQTYHGAQLAQDVKSEGRDVALSELPSASLVEANMIATNNGINGERSSHVDSTYTNTCTSNYSAHELGARYFAILFQ